MSGIKFFIKGIMALLPGGILLTACYTAPEFPNEPAISFNSIVFKKGADQFDLDSLILTINFKDGDGDLGLRNEGADTREPYHALWAFPGPDGLLKLSDRNNPDYDTLPPYEFPYYCTNYTIIEEGDTIYVEPNKFHYNIYVKYFVKKNGVYTEFDWLTEFDPICGESFNGRFPLLNNPNKERPLEGKLTYKMKSSGFELLFRQDTLKLETFIIDRALNISNTISTPDFVLKEITVGG